MPQYRRHLVQPRHRALSQVGQDTSACGPQLGAFAKEEKVARLHCLDVSAKRRRGGWELNAKVLQTATCTDQLRTFHAYHRPACAPPSTCSTSPVT